MTQPTLLCLASFFKGVPFLEAAHEAGARVLFLTQDRYKDEGWPRDQIDAFYHLPDTADVNALRHGVSYLARSERLDRIVALDDYDVLPAAEMREHLRLPGLSASEARIFRDKLAMRVQARDQGIAVPPFVGIFNYDRIRAFLAATPGPWLLKPRTEAGAMGIKPVSSDEELWRGLEQLGDGQSHYVLEAFVSGEVFHVDSLVADGRLLFASAQKYSRPPIQVAHEGGVFISRILPEDDPDARALYAANARLLAAFGLRNGATHTEFIKGAADGAFYFLETAARVGGANVAEMIAAGTDINLWREWARLEVARARDASYELPSRRSDYAGILVCLARQEYPDTGAYQDPAIVWRMQKKHHAGLIVADPDGARVAALLDEYGERFARDFLAVAPPLDRPPGR